MPDSSRWILPEMTREQRDAVTFWATHMLARAALGDPYCIKLRALVVKCAQPEGSDVV